MQTIEFIIIIIIACSFCIATIIIYNTRIKESFKIIDGILSSILAKKMCTEILITDESLESKLVHKANQVVRMVAEDVVQLEEEKQTIQSFLTDMSHQIKTPLAGVSMYTDLLIEGNLTPSEQEEFLNRIKLGTDKMKWMMESLVKISRLEVGAIELNPEPKLLKQTLTNAISGVYAIASKKNINLITSEFEDITVMHDTKWTAEAFANILENAVKYSHGDGEISIAVERLPIYTRISISNVGMEIEKSEWNMIFKRFYRGKNSEGIDGTGIGLYLVSIILQKQSGYAMVNCEKISDNKYRTCFSVFLQNCNN